VRAVSDAGPLIHLSWIDKLPILGTLFSEVLVPREVEREVLRAGSAVLGGMAIRAALATPWLQVRAVGSRETVAALRSLLDPGEPEAIVLMEEQPVDLLLLDDRRARAEAHRRGLRIAGTVGLLREAREQGLVPAVYPLVLELRRHGFRMSQALLDQIFAEESDKA
jgi:uncharacterized protein